MDWILFDCDGVLVDSEAVVLGVLAQRFGDAIGSNADLSSELRDLLGLPVDRIAATVGERCGVTFDADWVHEARQDIARALQELSQPIPDVVWALQRIDLPKAVVSNSNRTHVSGALERTGLDRFFGNAVFSAEQVECPKPAPDLYRHTAAMLGTSAGRCLVVEDSRAGVTAAVAAGTTVIGFTGGGHLPPGHADVQLSLGAVESIATMRDLPATIARLRGLTDG